MTPYYADDWLTVYLGDCRAILAELPADSVHCVITSPPYYGLRDYGTTGQIGLEPTPEQYVTELVAVFREVRRVLRPDGTVWLNVGDSYFGTGRGPSNGEGSELGLQSNMTRSGAFPTKGLYRHPGLKPKDRMMIPARVALALQADGWWLRDEIVWNKPNPMPSSVSDRTTPAHEMVYLLTKRARYWYDGEAIREAEKPWNGGRMAAPSLHESNREAGVGYVQRKAQFDVIKGANRRSVWTIATQPYPEAHFATFPEALVEPMVLAGCPERTCAECGAGWERVVEREKGDTEAADRPKRTAGMTDRTSTLSLSGNGSREWAERGSRSTTMGSRPTCAHDAPTLPGVVLDPFAGSGTVGLVAQRHSRRAILIDLSAEYMEQLMRRNADIPLGLRAYKP